VLRGLLFAFLGALVVAVLEFGLYSLLKRTGTSADIALLVLAIFSLSSLLTVGSVLYFQLTRETVEEGDEISKSDSTSSADTDCTSTNTASPWIYSSTRAELWQAAADLEATVRQVKGQGDYVKITAKEKPANNIQRKDSVKAAPSAAAIVSDPPREQSKEAAPVRKSWDTLSIAELLNEINALERKNIELINKSRDRMHDVERLMENRIHLISSDTIKAHINAKRIIGALERRLERVRDLVATSNIPELAKALRLLESDLVVPSDTMNTLIGTDQIPSVASGKIKTTLERLLSAAEHSLKELDQRSRRMNF
jgi:hypothetical protein